MNNYVSIISGGTGSLQIQTALHKLGIPYKIIINAYDNGLSTGDVRKIYDGEILGPSDLRKNQIHIAKLKNSQNRYLLDFLEKRFTANGISEYQFICLEEINKLDGIVEKKTLNFLYYHIERFLSACSADKFFDDYAVANMIYASIANDNENSLQIAGDVMAQLLNIPGDSVSLSSDISLFLTAETESGDLILDEADIVDLKDSQNKIKTIRLLDNLGNIFTPEFCPRAISILENSSSVIISTGTFWSSLAPTFIHKGFPELMHSIKMSNKSIYYFYNVVNDKDMYGVNLTEYLQLLENHFTGAIDICTFVFPSTLSEIADFHNTVNFPSNELHIIKHDSGNKHNVEYLYDFFKKNLQTHLNTEYLFDLDDTLIPRSTSLDKIEIGINNLEIIDKLISYGVNISIVTGNTVHRLTKFLKEHKERFSNGMFNKLKVFSSGGGQLYIVDLHTLNIEKSYSICSDLKISKGEVLKASNFLGKVGISMSHVSSRDGYIISAKPVSDRDNKVKLLNEMFENENIQLRAVASGKTTIDVFDKRYNKAICVKSILNELCSYHLYIGDEISTENGNDKSVKLAGYNCKEVLSVEETNILLRHILKGIEG